MRRGPEGLSCHQGGALRGVPKVAPGAWSFRSLLSAFKRKRLKRGRAADRYCADDRRRRRTLARRHLPTKARVIGSAARQQGDGKHGAGA